VIGGYIVALVMAFFVPKIYSAMAFDAGRIASGPMNSSFVLPFAIGAALTIYGVNGQDIMTYAFGVNALVTLMPIITIQSLGLYVAYQARQRIKLARARFIEENDDQIIHLNEERI
jgi:branched-subunit amino acid transport protein AzlD